MPTNSHASWAEFGMGVLGTVFDKVAADARGYCGLPGGPPAFVRLVQAVARPGGRVSVVDADATSASLSILHGGGRWVGHLLDRGPTVVLAVPSGLRLRPSEVPDGLADHLLARSGGVPCGGWVRATAEGRATYFCRAEFPAEGLSPETVAGAAAALAAEVADLHAAVSG